MSVWRKQFRFSFRFAYGYTDIDVSTRFHHLTSYVARINDCNISLVIFSNNIIPRYIRLTRKKNKQNEKKKTNKYIVSKRKYVFLIIGTDA